MKELFTTFLKFAFLVVIGNSIPWMSTFKRHPDSIQKWITILTKTGDFGSVYKSKRNPFEKSLIFTLCHRRSGLVHRQRRLCRKYPGLIGHAFFGVVAAMSECQHQFRNRHWNCSSITHPGKLNRLFRKLLSQGIEESSFIMALTSASISYSITKSCSRGLHILCGCDRSLADSSTNHNGQFRWSGCSDNLDFGNAFSRKFLDMRESKRKKRRYAVAKINLHNNDVGRQVLENHLQTQCKCHGLSGSCELKTCWRALPPFRRVADDVKKKFNSARHVELSSNNQLRIFGDPFGQPNRKSLIYLQTTPNICQLSVPNEGHIGRGRQCNRTSRGSSGCWSLCCNQGYHTRHVLVRRTCRCKFQWCCQVVCDVCMVLVELSRCL